MADATSNGSGARRTAFVFCGGAGLGAVQVGQLRALVERGIQPDVVSTWINPWNISRPMRFVA